MKSESSELDVTERSVFKISYSLFKHAAKKQQHIRTLVISQSYLFVDDTFTKQLLVKIQKKINMTSVITRLYDRANVELMYSKYMC